MIRPSTDRLSVVVMCVVGGEIQQTKWDIKASSIFFDEMFLDISAFIGRLKQKDVYCYPLISEERELAKSVSFFFGDGFRWETFSEENSRCALKCWLKYIGGGNSSYEFSLNGSKGKIEFKNYCFTYKNGTTLIIKIIIRETFWNHKKIYLNFVGEERRIADSKLEEKVKGSFMKNEHHYTEYNTYLTRKFDFIKRELVVSFSDKKTGACGKNTFGLFIK